MVSTQDVNVLKGDLEELETVLGNVNRANVRMMIADSISTLKTKIKEMSDEIAKNAQKNAPEKTTPSAPKQTLFTAKISNYATDEGDKFYKVYITVPNIDKLTQEQVTCDFAEQSFKLFVSNHNGKNHALEILKLAAKINVGGSTCRVKSGHVIVALKKLDATTRWGCLTDAEKKTKEKKDNNLDSKKDAPDSSGDPSAGIMDLMKKMYNDGDDDMKRMIKKTWYESQNKKAGEMPEMPEMPSF